MSLVGEPQPGNNEVTFTPKTREIIAQFHPDLPVFQEGGVKAAKIISKIDHGIVMPDKAGHFDDPDVDQFVWQYATAGFINRIYADSRRLLNRFNYAAPCLPQWLHKPMMASNKQLNANFKASEHQQIEMNFLRYGEKFGVEKKDTHRGQVYFKFPQFRERGPDGFLDMIDFVSKNAKIYIDGRQLLTWGNVEQFLLSLQKHGLHPNGGKYNFAAERAVFYYHSGVKDKALLLKLAKEAGVHMRGPAQDPVHLNVNKEGFVSFDATRDPSNDESLGRHPYNEKPYKAMGYEFNEFLRVLLQQTAAFCKNPAVPYELAAARVTWPQATDKARRAVDYIKQAVKARSGVDTLVSKPWSGLDTDKVAEQYGLDNEES